MLVFDQFACKSNCITESGIECIEIGAGTGRFTSELAKRFPNSRFTLTDIDDSALEMSKKLVQSMDLQNVTIKKLNVCEVNKIIQGTARSKLILYMAGRTFHQTPFKWQKKTFSCCTFL